MCGAIITIENLIQMTIFYDDQLELGGTWTYQTGIMPMLSNLLFSRWCATLGPGLWVMLKDENNTSKDKSRYIFWLCGHVAGFLMCIGVQILMFM